MDSWLPATGGWLYVSCFVLSVVSALFPWVNGELVLLSYSAVLSSVPGLIGVVLVGSTGQMVGKIPLYWAGRGTVRFQAGRVAQTLDRWRDRLEKRPSGPLSLVFIASSLGIPPFYVVSVVAGALGVRFGSFLFVGLLGRLVRFGLLVFTPHIVYRLFW